MTIAKINTKPNLKIFLQGYVAAKTEPFKTSEVLDDVKDISGKVRISPNHLTNFLRATGVVEYCKSKKQWIKKGSCDCGCKD